MQYLRLPSKYRVNSFCIKIMIRADIYYFDFKALKRIKLDDMLSNFVHRIRLSVDEKVMTLCAKNTNNHAKHICIGEV